MANTSTMPERTPPKWPVQSSETLPSPDAREADILPIQDTASQLNLDPCPWSWARLVIDTSNKQGYWAGKSNGSSRHLCNLGNPVLTRCSPKFLLLLWATDMTVSHGGGIAMAFKATTQTISQTEGQTDRKGPSGLYCWVLVLGQCRASSALIYLLPLFFLLILTHSNAAVLVVELFGGPFMDRYRLDP
ncbi:hypothetical protein PV10_07667 [Exophiala mesophila]|uniref:Uncharacterized protein n=1 Tax=Exophiala mesophila TaxID=212818 RepID=A0A0D1WMV3_EXOME|nr:uncharacterized protein PV10_07667 [Exophiala mesophila]KIV90355.1 hypothetical protein PV10_07667 [Exophiala mesophila]